MDVEKILLVTTPEQIFSTMDEDIIHREYRKMMLDVHPDKNKHPKASVAASHVANLYKQALEKVKIGVWDTPGIVFIKANTGQTFKLKYFYSGDFALGKFYIGTKHLSYHIKPEHNKLFENAVSMISSFKYKSDKMKTEVSKYLPNIEKNITTVDGERVLVLKKEPDMIRLADVLKYLKGSIDPKHIAWILSSLHNLCCYFHVEAICHNDISIENYYISPEGHSGALYGGWWYSRHSGEKLLSVPNRTFKLMPSKQVDSKIASRNLNLELIRDIGTTLLGGKTDPAPMTNWFKLPPMKNAIEDYKIWYNKVLIDSFGKHKYVKLDLTSKEVYSKIK